MPTVLDLSVYVIQCRCSHLETAPNGCPASCSLGYLGSFCELLSCRIKERRPRAEPAAALPAGSEDASSFSQSAFLSSLDASC